jgi:hypothetical protein
MKRYHLASQGTDLVSVDIKDGVIVGVMLPHLEKMFVGQLNYDFFADHKIKKGDQIRYSESPNHPIKKITWPVEKVQDIKIVFDAPQDVAEKFDHLKDEVAKRYDPTFDETKNFMYEDVENATFYRVGAC